jgi:hypothetical protein
MQSPNASSALASYSKKILDSRNPTVTSFGTTNAQHVQTRSRTRLDDGNSVAMAGREVTLTGYVAMMARAPVARRNNSAQYIEVNDVIPHRSRAGLGPKTRSRGAPVEA